MTNSTNNPNMEEDAAAAFNKGKETLKQLTKEDGDINVGNFKNQLDNFLKNFDSMKYYTGLHILLLSVTALIMYLLTFTEIFQLDSFPTLKYIIPVIFLLCAVLIDYFKHKKVNTILNIKNVNFVNKLLYYGIYAIIFIAIYGGWSSMGKLGAEKFGRTTGYKVMEKLKKDDDLFNAFDLINSGLGILMIGLLIGKNIFYNRYVFKKKEEILSDREKYDKNLTKGLVAKDNATKIIDECGLHSMNSIPWTHQIGWLAVFFVPAITYIILNIVQKNMIDENAVDKTNEAGSDTKESFQTMSKIDRDFVKIFKKKNKDKKIIHKLNEIFPLNHDKYSTVLNYSPISGKINL